MKFWLLLLPIGLALAFPETTSFYPKLQDTSFLSGREYIYRYDTQALTGFPHASKIHAGFRMNLVAHVQFLTVRKVRVRFDEVFLYRINEPIVQWKASERLLPEEFLKEIVGDEATTMEGMLSVPFGFEYSDGMVLNIALADTETTWSENVKKGFVALFEMNLHKRMALDHTYPVVKTSFPNVDLYNVLERSPVGDCVTMYTVSPTAEQDHMFVTKVRDYNRCLNRTVYTNTVWDGDFIEDAQRDNPLMNGATVKYTLRGNKKEFVILSAVGEGRIVLSPYKNEESVKTTLNQTMVLRDIKVINREVPAIPEIKQYKKDSIHMILPASLVDCQDPFNPCFEEAKPVVNTADAYTLDKIYLHLRMAAENARTITSEEALLHTRIFKEMLKTAPESLLKKLWLKCTIPSNTGNTDLLTQIYWDALTKTGTEDAAYVVLDICRKDLNMADNCTRNLGDVVLKTIPNERMIDELLNLTTVHRQILYLSLGTFGHKLTREMERQQKHCEDTKIMLNALVQDETKIGQLFVAQQEKTLSKNCNRIASVFSSMEDKILMFLSKLATSPVQEDKILALKAIGNSGLPGSLPMLNSFLYNVTESSIVRVMAITAHRRILYPEVARQLAIKTLLNLYLTTSEKNEIRTMSFLIMTGLRPNLPILETIASSLHYEKDSQVSSFVYNYFVTFANSTYRPDWPLQMNCTAALKLSPEVNTGLEHSFYRRFYNFNADLKQGNALSVAALGDMTRYLGAAVNWDSYNYGLNSKTFEAGINTEGLSPVLNALFGPKGFVSSQKSLFELLRRHTRDVSPQVQIQEIFKKLNIKSHLMPNAYGHIYFKVMGNEMFYIDFTRILEAIEIIGQLPHATEEESMNMTFPVNMNTVLTNQDNQMIFPTEAGLPVTMNSKTTAALNVQGALNFKVVPYNPSHNIMGGLPVALFGGWDLKPKVVLEVECTMGLDMFYLKPVVGLHGLVKWNAPIKQDFQIDFSTNRMNFNWYKYDLVQPSMEMLFEPFSEFMLISKEIRSPVLISDRRNIYAPEAVRVLPISHNIKFNALGHELNITGQLPFCVAQSRTHLNPMCLYSGRSIVNMFWSPLEDAPAVTRLSGQFITPVWGVDPTTQTNKAQEDEDNNKTEFTDPDDIMSAPVTLKELCTKFEKIFRKPMPYYINESTHALILVLDASGETNKRQLQLETMLHTLRDGHVGEWFTRFWRSSIPDYDTKEWELLNEFGITYPLEVMEPTHIFDREWQQELMRNLEYLISLESHKVANQGINMTILSELEQLNYPAMIRLPTYRVLDSLIPEQLYFVMNTTSHMHWEKYWQHLGPIYGKVSEEIRLNVDPYFVKRDLPLLNYLQKLVFVQESLRSDLKTIAALPRLPFAELSILQWVGYTQAKTYYMIREIFNKASMQDLIVDPDRISALLTVCEANLNIIVTNTRKLMEIDNDNLSQIQSYQHVTHELNTPLLNYEDDMEEKSASHWRETDQELRLDLFNLSYTQALFIEALQLSISEKKEIDFDKLTELHTANTNILNLLDGVLRKRALLDALIRQELLQVTVQNEYTIELLEQWRKQMGGQIKNLDLLRRNLMLLKEQGVYLGERVSMLYHMYSLNEVVVPQLTTPEFHIFEATVHMKRIMVTELRSFEKHVAYNMTNWQDPAKIKDFFRLFSVTLNMHAHKISHIEVALRHLGKNPQLYVMSELMDALHYLKHMTEFGTRTIYQFDDAEKFVYLTKLTEMATKVEGLLSALSPIFNKYSEYQNTDIKNPMTVWSTLPLPVHMHIQNVQDVIVQQKLLKEKIQKYIYQPEGPGKTVFSILKNAVDYCQELHMTLNEYHTQLLVFVQDRTSQEKEAVFAIWSKALKQQYDLYEIVVNFYNNHQDQLKAFAPVIRKVHDLQSQLGDLLDIIPENMDTLEENDAVWVSDQVTDDDSVQQAMKQVQPFSQSGYLPTGVVAVFNLTWGNQHSLNKSASWRFLASRSVEQIMTIFKQMNAVVRDQDIVNSINQRLSDEPYLEDPVMQSLNTFNHWHFILEAEKENLPEWLMNFGLYLKDFFKATYWNNYCRQPSAQFISENQIQAMFDFSFKNREMDFYLFDEGETAVYRGVNLRRSEIFPVFQNYKPAIEKVSSYYTEDHKPSKCMVRQDNVLTFDKVTYQFPSDMKNKEVLLAADCAEEKNFAVTMKRSTGTLGQTFKFIDFERIVEVTPRIYFNMEVKVDGTVIVLENNKPVIISKKMHYGLYQPALIIVRKGLRVEVQFPLTGMYFVIEGDSLQMEVSEMYRRRVCGLCGNFDNQKSWEFEGPQREVYSSSDLFVKMYTFHEDNEHLFTPENPDFTIQNDKYRNVVSHYKSREDQTKKSEMKIEPLKKIDENKPIDCTPLTKTIMKTRRYKNQRCFSIEHVSKCPDACSVIVKKEIVKVPFVCLKTHDSMAKKLETEAKKGPINDILKEVKNPRIIRRNVKKELQCRRA